MNLFYGSNTNSLLHFIHCIIIFNSNEQDGRQDILDYWNYEGYCKSSQSDQDTLLKCKQMRYILFFNIEPLVVNILLPSVFQCLEPISEER